jgi:uncharacterized protein YecE (DUF72 family)
MPEEPRIRVGTASWTDPTLIKETDWYPKGRCRRRSGCASTPISSRVVEVDATYYFPPTENMAAKWVERTPQQFLFDIKAFGLFTGYAVKREAVWDEVAEGPVRRRRATST